jgi:DNA-binding NarL/FixJ family response regulator
MPIDKINILLVDDDALLRDGLRSLLEKEAFTKTVFEAVNRESCLAMLSEHTIQVILLDIRLKESSGVEILHVLKSREQCPKIIVITGLEGKELIVNLLKYGVDGIVFKLDGYKEIINTINQTLKLGHHFPEKILEIIKTFSHQWEQVPSVILTFQEKELLKAIEKGLTTKEIANSLKMSESTTETYRIRLLKKIGVPNTASLLAFAYRNGLL